MKKLLCVLCIAALLCSCAFAEDIDLSGLSFQELEALRNRCLLEMMQRDEWQEVEVPAGVWEIGVDIPAGHWSFRAGKQDSVWNNVTLMYGDALEFGNKGIDVSKSSFFFMHTFDDATPTYDLELSAGYLVVLFGSVIVTPYTGKPDLGFKFN